MKNTALNPKACTIVDYGVGNIFSLRQAVEHCGWSAEVTRDKQAISNAHALILPGVGAYGHAMKKLHEYDLVKTLQQYAQSGKKLLGICLGMQLLFMNSSEDGMHEGLSILNGNIRPVSDVAPSARVPIIGWYQIKNPEQVSLFRNIYDPVYYFIHGFSAGSYDPSLNVCTIRIGDASVCAAVNKGNVYGCQFHPEKSASAGLQTFKNFLDG